MYVIHPSVWFGSTLKWTDYKNQSKSISLIWFGSSSSLDQSDLFTLLSGYERERERVCVCIVKERVSGKR